MTSCFTAASARLTDLVAQQIRGSVGTLSPRRIVIKPNWVQHETDPAFPISALVTDPRVIDAVVEACAALFPGCQSILVADCPLQSADWPLMCRQSGLDLVIGKWKARDERVVFRDLRKEVFRKDKSGFMAAAPGDHGDARGYREIELGAESHLEEISDQRGGQFAVSDYSASVTSSNHKKGAHRYLVSQSILDADLLINVPKWKSHQKSGITGALKNLVGINSDKAYLPHFRRGAPKWGGDEFRNEGRFLYFAQTRMRELLQKRSALAFKLLKPGWELIKAARGIETRYPSLASPPKNFYIAAGSWYGNETIWRMIYDLNMAIQRFDAEGVMKELPQRNYLCIVDGLVSGEGNGPLQPIPRATDWLVFGSDPFEIDTTLAWFMGFDPRKIPLLHRRAEYHGVGWGDFALDTLQIELDGERKRLQDCSLNFAFAPPPGWKDHIER